MPVIIKDFFMFTAFNLQKVMNVQIFLYTVIQSTGESELKLGDELSQPTSFQTARSNIKTPKNPIKPKKQWVGLFLKSGFSEPCLLDLMHCRR